MKPLKYVFQYYKFTDKRISDSLYGYDDDDRLGVVICPKCNNAIEVKKKWYGAKGKCICGVYVSFRKPFILF
jgi:hypothetical protein